MRTVLSTIRTVYLAFFLLGFQAVYAHNPDLASLMIYEQNGKSILLIKSSLTAFEGEIDYKFGKGAYKTPEEFNQLVAQHFQNNFSVLVNGQAVKFSNVQVQLGHETNLFAELDNMPKTIESFYVSNTVFKDMPNNKCELILALNGFPQKQYILNNENDHEVKLSIAGDRWVVDTTTGTLNFTPNLLLLLTILSVASMIFLVTRKRIVAVTT